MIPKFRGQEKDIEYYHSLAALAVCCGVAGLVLTRMTTKFLNKKVCMRYQVAERFVVDQQNNLLIRYLLLSSPGDGGDAGASSASRHVT